MVVSVRSAMVSQFCVRPTSKRWFLKNSSSDHETRSIRCHVGIQVDVTSFLAFHIASSVVWSELGLALPFPPTSQSAWSAMVTGSETRLVSEVALWINVGHLLYPHNHVILQTFEPSLVRSADFLPCSTSSSRSATRTSPKSSARALPPSSPWPTSWRWTRASWRTPAAPAASPTASPCAATRASTRATAWRRGCRWWPRPRRANSRPSTRATRAASPRCARTSLLPRPPPPWSAASSWACLQICHLHWLPGWAPTPTSPTRWSGTIQIHPQSPILPSLRLHTLTVTTYIIQIHNNVMFCGTDNVPGNVLKYSPLTSPPNEGNFFRETPSIPHNSVMDLNNVMNMVFSVIWYFNMSLWWFFPRWHLLWISEQVLSWMMCEFIHRPKTLLSLINNS